MAAGRMTVQVVALAGGCDFNRKMQLPVGQTVGFALQASGVKALYPVMQKAEVGVFGVKATAETVLQEGERVELYLPCNPAAVKQAQEKRRSTRSGTEMPETTAKTKTRLPNATGPG